MNNIALSRQFSLRTLVLVVLASGVLFGAWRAFGTAVCLAFVFAIFSAVVVAALKGTWKRAYLLSWSAVYVPFAVMATYTLLNVSCSHCKAAVWTVLPCAPALIPIEIGRRVFDLPRPSDAIGFVVA